MKIVIKIGTSTLTHSTGRTNIRRVADLCRVISDLKNAGHEIILVSSGAIAMGVGKLNLSTRPSDAPTKQAAAAVGQCELMYIYDRLFAEHNHTVAQLLITAPDIDDPVRKENFHDTLSATVAASVNADLLVLLSDIDGLYDQDPHINPHARLIPVVEKLDEHILSLAGGKGSALGTGGMVTKLRAAQIAGAAGVDMVIANGQDPLLLYDIAEGRPVGTKFLSGKRTCEV